MDIIGILQPVHICSGDVEMTAFIQLEIDAGRIHFWKPTTSHVTQDFASLQLIPHRRNVS